MGDILLAIRVDGNSKVGIGHVQRCISIGECLRELGKAPIFIMSDTCAKELVVKKGFKFICIDSKWNNIEGEINKLFNIIKNFNISTILLDSYSVTSYYTDIVGDIVNLFYIDDFYINYFRNLKGIISYNIGCDFTKKLYDFPTQNILGIKYVPLRKEFNNISPVNVGCNIKNIVITTGATDKYLIVEDFIKMFIKEPSLIGINLHVVIGRFFTNKDMLEKFSNDNEKIILYHNTTKITDIMLRCDMAISAGGTTLYELCVCGLPTVAFCIADNQRGITKALYGQQALLYSGDYSMSKDKLLKNILNNTLEVIKDKSLRQELQHKAINILDAKGAMRIAQKIIKYV